MKCPGCQFENPPEALFCMKCGTKLERKCPHCGTECPEDAFFCMKCGKRLVAEEPPIKELSLDEKLEKFQRYLPKGLTEKILSQRDKIEGERKQVTVMFCDMEGFTSLSEKLGPEEAYTLMDQIYEILINKVHDYDGTINEMTGDGIMALFGAPIALEDAPQRAIRSAYAIHRQMTRFNDNIRQAKGAISPIRIRIGIHTGPVVVGTLGNDLRVEFKAVGDTVNLASRMEEIAEPGTTYVTEDTYKFTEGLFLFEELGEKEVKGKQEPVRVYRVVAPSSIRTRFDVRTKRGLTPFVGREREVELLLDGFKWSKSGRGQAFSIIAEAGMGKSRLLLEFRKALADDEVVFLEGNCLSYSRNIAYFPIIDILKSRFSVFEEDRNSDIREKVTRGLRDLGADEASTLPYILELLSIQESGIDEILMSPEVRKNRTMEALKHILLKSSEVQPLIVAIENLHWIDRSSEDALIYLLESIPGASVLLIFTYRPEYIHSWGARSYHSQINLNRLSNRENLSMIYHLLGTDNIDRPLAEMILQKAEGIPLFIEEFIKSLQDLKAIEKKDETYHIVIDVQTVAIPTEIQDIIMARLDSLPDGAKSLAQAGSVIGREFSHNLIERVVGFPEQELFSSLSVLKDSEMLYERGIYPQTTYVFKHALIQDVAYHSLLKNTRQRYHRLIAEALEQGFPETTKTQPATLGHHFTEAGLPEPAISYWQQAGEMATRRSANIEAIAHFTNGLELLKTLPETHERMKRELKLLILIGSPLTAIKGETSQEVERTYSRARGLCEKVGEPQLLSTVLYGLWNFHMGLGEYQTSLKYAGELLSIANFAQDHSNLLAAHRALGASLFWLGDLTNAHYHMEQALAFYEPKQHHHQAFLYWTDQGLHTLSYTTIILWLLGYADQALKRVCEVLTLAYKLSHAYSRAMAIVLVTFARCYLREIDRTKESAKELIDYSTKNRFPILLNIGEVMRLWALGMEKKENDIIDKMNRAIAELHSIPYDNMKSFFRCLLAEVCIKYGQIEEGLTKLEEAQTWMVKTGERFWEAELHRLKGEMHSSQSLEGQKEAESCFHQAIEVAQHQRAKSLELRAAMSLSRLWQSQGKMEEAKRLLSDIYDWFTEGFDTADLKDAKALLEKLS